MKHDCKQTYTKNEQEFYNFICSRCDGCYVCKHHAIMFQDGVWHWKCKNGKMRAVILDGRVPR